MQVGLIGLGRMGAGMARRLQAAGHEVVAFNRTAEKAQELERDGVVTAATTMAELVEKLAAPRVVFTMVTAGEATDAVIAGPGGLVELLDEGDVVVDAGNANFQDSVRLSEVLSKKGIHFMDQGTSGGLAGAQRGYCVMVGGSDEDFQRVEPLLQALAGPDGYAHVGPLGAGHFAKMVHNAMEYGMMESIAEGMELLARGPYQGYDFAKLLELWQHGSIISSYLLQVLQVQFRSDNALDSFSPSVADNGEGRWAIEEALTAGVPFPAISAALFARYYSRGQSGFAGRVLSAMRKGFGGHQK